MAQLKILGTEEPKPQETQPGLAPIGTEPAPPTTTFDQTAQEGFAQGLSWNSSDEMAAALEAAAKDRQPGESFDQAYQRHFTRRQEEMRKMAEERPGTFYGAQIAGGIAGSVVNPIQGRTRLEQTAQGAAEGAAQGFAGGESLPERALGGVIGGGGGAVGGFISPEIGRVASTAALRWGRPLLDRVAALMGGPGGARQVAVALKEAGFTDPQEIEQIIQTATQRGQPVTLGDVGDRATARVAQTASNLNPEAGMVVGDAVDQRNAERVDRFRNYLTGLIPGYGNTAAERQVLRQASRTANKAAYDTSYAAAPGGMWDQELTDIATSPAVQQAIRDVEKKSAERAVASGGKSTLRNPFDVDKETGAVTLKDPNMTPGLEFWDQVQRNLREQEEEAGKGFFGGKSSAATDIADTRRRLLGHLDKSVPDFGKARGQAMTFFQASDALDLGQRLANDTGLSSEALADGLKSLSTLKPADKRLAQAAYVDALSHRAGTTTTGGDVVRTLMGSENDKAIQLALFGKDKAAQMDAFQKAEGMMQLFSNRALGGSPTAQRAMDLLARTGAGTLLGGSIGATAGLYQGENEKTLGGTGAATGALAGMIFSGVKGAVGRQTALTAAKYLMSTNAGDRRAVYKMMEASPELRDAVSNAAIRLGGMLSSELAQEAQQ